MREVPRVARVEADDVQIPAEAHARCEDVKVDELERRPDVAVARPNAQDEILEGFALHLVVGDD